jgi:hypothetical protein
VQGVKQIGCTARRHGVSRQGVDTLEEPRPTSRWPVAQQRRAVEMAGALDPNDRRRHD